MNDKKDTKNALEDRALSRDYVIRRLDLAVRAAREDHMSSKVLLDFDVAEELLKMTKKYVH
ncbi:hypothetical protein [Neoaquamicrobium sediminum]|uniref:hypothetical protein n=1 Tax=Neoaquamicrobium sediminum TaxID=1849104 RepID=UPI00156578F6|nr:hypothetical protein [Mesorhizobium sediminum]NRC56202.1 hypothetical protein [Mesorhizobium sediminum]